MISHPASLIFFFLYTESPLWLFDEHIIQLFLCCPVLTEALLLYFDSLSIWNMLLALISQAHAEWSYHCPATLQGMWFVCFGSIHFVSLSDLLGNSLTFFKKNFMRWEHFFPHIFFPSSPFAILVQADKSVPCPWQYFCNSCYKILFISICIQGKQT